MNPVRRATQRVVYGFLAWFESFDSVWQTTLICIGGTAIEDAFPRIDPGHLVFLLILSLYATFTQNGLAHGNQLTSDKIDDALDRIEQQGRVLLRFARNEEHVQAAVVEQGQAVAAALAELRTGLIELRNHAS